MYAVRNTFECEHCGALVIPCRRCEDGSARKHEDQDESLCIKCCMGYESWESLKGASRFALGSILDLDPSPLGPSPWEQHLRHALETDLYELSQGGIIQVSYSHKANQPVVIVQGALIPGTGALLDESFLLLIKQTYTIISEPFIVVYIHPKEHSLRDRFPPFEWLQNAANILTEQYASHLTSLLLVGAECFNFRSYLMLRTRHSLKAIWRKTSFLQTTLEVSEALGMAPEKFELDFDPHFDATLAYRDRRPSVEAREWLRRDEALAGGITPPVSPAVEPNAAVSTAPPSPTNLGPAEHCEKQSDSVVWGERGSEGEQFIHTPPHLAAAVASPTPEASAGELGRSIEEGTEEGTEALAAVSFDASEVPVPVAGERTEDLVGLFRRIQRKGEKNRWSEVSAGRFQVRGKSYLENKNKVRAGESIFELVNADLFATTGRNEHVALWPMSAYQKAKRNAVRTGLPAPFMLIINWVIPGTPRYNQVNYFVRRPIEDIDPRPDAEYERMLQHFLEGSNDKFRDKRFKLIPTVEEGPWIVKAGVGKTPAILGSKLSQKYFQGDGYLEIDIDVGSSQIAGQVLKMCKNAAEQLVIDLAFTIEGKKEAELPEHILGAVRLHQLSLKTLDKQGDPITGSRFTPDTEYEP